MDPASRQAVIINIIRQRHRITVDELAEDLNISRETIRRDLSKLARIGKVLKFHGGASLPNMISEGSFSDRMGDNVAEKVLIAGGAIKLILPGQTIFVDTGSTTLYFAEKLAEKFAEIPNLTIITNATEIARTVSLSSSHTHTFLLGGEFNGDNKQTIGSMVISQIQSFRAHHAILTIGALDARTGVMDFNIDEAQVAQAMIEQAESLTLLVDSSKFGQIASFKVCGLSRVTNLVCDLPPSGKLEEALMEAGVNIFTAAK